MKIIGPSFSIGREGRFKKEKSKIEDSIKEEKELEEVNRSYSFRQPSYF